LILAVISSLASKFNCFFTSCSLLLTIILLPVVSPQIMGLHIPADSQKYGGIQVKELYAHSASAQGKRHCLDSHLKEVAALSQKFADKFGAEDPAHWLCLWHDLGKYSR
jgi:hypothetical protein